MKNSAKVFSLPFLKHEQVAHNTYSFFFDRSGVDFDFIPGQYIRMTLPHNSPDERGTSRYFTIASSPLEKKYLMVTTKMMQSTFKETLHSLKKGNSVQFFGPMGWFLLPEDGPFEKVFIAGGIGITPFHSLLLTIVQEQLPSPITLFALFSSKDNAIFYNELTAVAKKNSQIRVIYSISNAQESQNSLESEAGRISEVVIKKHIKDIYKPKYYIVGSFGMVEGTKALLQSMKIDEEKIFTEDFTGY